MTPDAAAAIALVAALVAAYLALGVGRVVAALRRAVAGARGRAGALAGPAAVWLVALAHAALTGQALGTRALAYGAYLLAPALVAPARALAPGALAWRDAARVLAAAALLWLPIELRLLPPLPAPVAGGEDVSRLLGLVSALWLFLVAAPVHGVGYTFALRRRDVAVALRAFVAFAAVALPVGFATAFIRWHPQLDPGRVLSLPPLIFVGIAVPEEFLFRGLIQNVLVRAWRPAPALVVASVVFGLAHLPDPRYVVLATGAGLAYGWVHLRTGRITAAAVTHALVDAAWSLLLRA